VNINATLIAQIIVFLVLVWFTMKFIWPPVIQALDERSKKIAEGLAAAEEGHKQLAQASKLAEGEVHKAREQAAAILANADKVRHETIEKAKSDATAEAQALMDKAKVSIELEASRAKDVLRDRVASLAVLGAERILRREIDAKAHADLLSALQQEL